MNKTKRRGILAVKTVAFVLLFAFVYSILHTVLINKDAIHEISSFQYEPRDSIDVLLLGPSTMVTSISPMQLWEEQGFTNYNIAMGGQSLAVNYYNLKMALERQSPKLLVLDIGYLFSQDILAGQPTRLHQLLDYTAFSFVKFEAIFDLVGIQGSAEYLLSVPFYHNRWSELDARDFHPTTVYNKGAIAYQFLTGDGPEQENNLTVCAPSDMSDIYQYEISMRYMQKIVDLCKENQISLLFTNLPSYAQGKVSHGDGFTLQRMWNGFAPYAEEQGCNYINYLHLLDEIDFDFSTDTTDWRHLNYSGQFKVTQYLGEYIQAHYDIPDRRNDENYAQWRTADEIYQQELQTRLDAWAALQENAAT